MLPCFINIMATTDSCLRHPYTSLSPHLAVAISVCGSAPSFEALRHSRSCPAPTVQELGTYQHVCLLYWFSTCRRHLRHCLRYPISACQRGRWRLSLKGAFCHGVDSGMLCYQAKPRYFHNRTSALAGFWHIRAKSSIDNQHLSHH